MTAQKRIWTTAAIVACVPVVFSPIGDPDLWWHLSSAREMVAQAGWLRVDSLPSTMSGLPWTNFEWLAQLAFYGVYCLFGLAGLWLLKAGLLGLVGAAVGCSLGSSGLTSRDRVLGLVLWATAMISRADIRTELFSLVAFAWLLYFLERRERRPGSPAVSFFLFAFWVNAHAGFLFGLLLLGAYVAQESRTGRGDRLWRHLAAGAAGTLVNPYGWRVYEVLWSHARDGAGLSRYIGEWGPLDPADPRHAPVWLAMVLLCALFLRGRRTIKESFLPAVMTALFGLAAVRHARFSPYFVVCAAVYGGRLIGKRESVSGRAAVVILAGCALFALTWAGTGIYQTRYTPVRVTAFLESRPLLWDLRLYNAWGWGGYLGYRLAGRMRIFQDGRYLFHPRLIEAGKAARRPGDWQAFLDSYGIQAAVLQNRSAMMETTRRYPDGSTRSISRPYYVQFMPKERWALVYWDDQALVFLRRDVLVAKGLADQEFRLARPQDADALEDALARGEIDIARLRLERTRQKREVSVLPVSPR